MTTEREAIGKVLFALSVPLTVLALLCFALPVIGIASGSYKEGMDGFLFFVFYALLAAPAGALIAGGIWLVGWKKAKFGKNALAVLFGIPAMVITVLIVGVIIYAVFGNK